MVTLVIMAVIDNIIIHTIQNTHYRLVNLLDILKKISASFTLSGDTLRGEADGR